MNKTLYTSVAFAALIVPTTAFAQSTGTQVFEQGDIVVIGPHDTNQGVSGVVIPKSTKARQTLNSEFIQRQTPGQSIDDIINMMPGVSFQNNGPYGDAGGTLTIHGFDSSRISQTFDGVPMNDSGNYALYSQEQLDPELIRQVDVSLGSTDLDSPTASATGSTVNYVLRDPTEDFHARLVGSVGDWQFMRVFGVVDTGNFTRFGTRAFFSASNQTDVNPYDSSSKINKTQLNAKIYQPIGENGDFVSLNGFHVRNRGNKFNDLTLDQFPDSSTNTSLRPEPCLTTPATPGTAGKANPCGQASAGYYGYGQNPSNILRLHINSRLTVADGLILTLEPNYEHTEANGSGQVIATEGIYSLYNGDEKTPIYGYIGGKPYFGGVDLNGDGDTMDTVLVDAPSNTVTKRYGIIANLIYKVSATQEFRINYTLDHARLRQTGEVGRIGPNGRPISYFPSNNPIDDISGNPMEKRNRLSYSILNQVSGEYRGKFFNDKLVINAGARAPFFSRKLHNYCVSESGGNGYVDCFNDVNNQSAFLDAHPDYQAPQDRNLHYDKILPSAGLTYNFTPAAQFFINYSEGLQVPSTDVLYDAFAFPRGDDQAYPKSELSKNYEGGVRYTSRKVQAQLSGWFTSFSNRIQESLVADPQNEGQYISVYTNLGTVHKYGVDGSVAYAPIRELTLYAFGSYMHSKILDNVDGGVCTANNVKHGDPAGGTAVCETIGQPITYQTAGKRESGAPTYTLGGRAQGNFGPLEIGIQAKRTGPRYVNDQNTPIYDFSDGLSVAYGAKTPSYTVVDLDARLQLGFLGLNDKTYIQINVQNLFDKFYVGGFDGQISNSSSKGQYVYVGTPRTFSATINVAF